MALKVKKVFLEKIIQKNLALEINLKHLEKEDLMGPQEKIRKKALALKVKKVFLEKMIQKKQVTQIIPNILVKKLKRKLKLKTKERILVLKQKRNLRIEVDQNHLNLKNIEKIKTYLVFFFFSFFSFLLSFSDNLGLFITLESLNDFPLYLLDILIIIS